MGTHFQNPASTAEFLASTDVVDWFHPDVHTLAWLLAAGADDPVEIARRCFEWVRDEIQHSVDFGRTEVTCRASEVLAQQTGFCYAKSHLLAARAHERNPGRFLLPAALVQRSGRAVLPPRPQRRLAPQHRLVPHRSARQQAGRPQSTPGVHAKFDPPHEHLAFAADGPGEATLPEIYPEPLPAVVQVLRQHPTVAAVCRSPPRLSTDGCHALSHRDYKAFQVGNELISEVRPTSLGVLCDLCGLRSFDRNCWHTTRFVGPRAKPPLTRFFLRRILPTRDERNGRPTGQVVVPQIANSFGQRDRRLFKNVQRRGGQNEPRGRGSATTSKEVSIDPLSGWRWHGGPFSATIHSPTSTGRPPPSRPDVRPPARKRYCVQSLPER